MSTANIKRSIKKGEILFHEGDKSESMFFIQNGAIRLFKSKGSSSIELGLIHKGEIIGEMGFLDGGARSASAEALYDTELTEINNANLLEQMKTLPQWLMVMMKTIVNRLRSANNKIRQLESSATSLNYKSDGSMSSEYTFLSPHDVIKIGAAILLVGARGGEPVVAEDGTKAIKCAMPKILKYGRQVMGMHENKVTELIDVLEKVGLSKTDRSNPEKICVYLLDIDQIETLVNFISDENQKEASKQIHLNIRSVVVMGYIVKHIHLFPPSSDGISEINLLKIIADEKAANNGKEPFRTDEILELVKNKISTELSMKDSSTATIKVIHSEIIKMFKLQKTLKEIEMVNEKKRSYANKARS